MFILGLITGAFFGALLMAVLSVNNMEDNDDESSSETRL